MLASVSVRYLIASVLCLPVSVALAQQDQPTGPWRLAETVVVDEEAWIWNWASWDQDKIATAGRFQYTVFWDADRAMVLARRDLQDNRVQALRLPQFQLSSNDPHRNTCLGVSLADGRLHVSWDHHNNRLHYTRTRAGFLTDPPPQMTAADIEPEQPIAQQTSHMSRVTYPRFFNDAKEQLFLFYREGGSGNGDNYLYRYEAQEGTWREMGKVFSARGIYGPWENSASRNAYLHDLLFDRDNRLHATWVYREISATWASNHDLHYAYSDDGGETWFNNAGRLVANLPEGDPIELEDPGIVVREIPVFSWVMNAGCMALDSQGRPHVMTYKLEDQRRPEPLQHNPPLEILDRLRIVHYWRDEDGRWLGGEPIASGVEYGHRARGDIVFDADDTLYFFYQPKNSESGFVCLESPAAQRWTRWRAYPLAGPEIKGKDATKHDRSRWARDRVLSFTSQWGPQGFAIVDLTLERERPSVGLVAP